MFPNSGGSSGLNAREISRVICEIKFIYIFVRSFTFMARILSPFIYLFLVLGLQRSKKHLKILANIAVSFNLIGQL